MSPRIEQDRDIELGSSSFHEEDETIRQPLIKESSPADADDSPSANTVEDATKSSSMTRSTTTSGNKSVDTGFGSVYLESLHPTQQMIILSFAMFLFFGMHNVLQEAIVNLLANSTTTTTSNAKADGTIMLGFAECTGVLFFSYLERVHVAKERGFHRVAPLKAYPLLTLCLFASSSLCNMSLSYINFPTKVVFRSCKLVPTMVIATIVNKRIFASYEYVCALSICAGMVLFAKADYILDPMKFDITGLALVSGSVVADAILPNAQERLFRQGSSRLEVTVFSNLFTFLAMGFITLSNGTLFKFAKVMAQDHTIALYFGLYTVLSYISISCYMTLVKRFGGVTAVLLTTARKAMTLVLSFLLFPKGFSWLYVHGSLLVLGACMVASIFKKLEKVPFQRKRSSEYSVNYRDNSTESSVTPSDDQPPADNSGVTRRGAGVEVV
jgi:adenosine 3'-phospho 5'-phosphosulfate transporter B3